MHPNPTRSCDKPFGGLVTIEATPFHQSTQQFILLATSEAFYLLTKELFNNLLKPLNPLSPCHQLPVAQRRSTSLNVPRHLCQRPRLAQCMACILSRETGKFSPLDHDVSRAARTKRLYIYYNIIYIIYIYDYMGLYGIIWDYKWIYILNMGLSTYMGLYGGFHKWRYPNRCQ